MDVHLKTDRSATGARMQIDLGEIRSLLSSLSHELSRPLISLRAGFDLLLSDSGTSISTNQRGHLLTMVSLCDELLRLTRSYLDYAALVHGSRNLRYGTFSIGAILREIDRQFAATASAQGLTWEVVAEQPDSPVTTDASHCQQIFGNLVSNALKYTPEGGRVRVVGRADADHWCVTVEDDGPGIPPEALERVFEPFYRLARDEHSRVEGNGLGLSICHELVTQLQGQILLNSGPGGGTTATVRLPLTPRVPTVDPALRGHRGTRGKKKTSGNLSTAH